MKELLCKVMFVFILISSSLRSQVPSVEVQLQHSGNINALAFSPDGKWLATGASDNQARLWNIQSQKILLLPSHRGPVMSVEFSPDGKYVATGSHDGSIQFWDMTAGSPAFSLFDSMSVRKIKFKPESKRIVSCGIEGIRIWDLAQKKITHQWPALQPTDKTPIEGLSPTFHFDSFSISHHGKLVAAAGGTYWTGWVREAGNNYKSPKNSKTGYVRLIDTETGEEWSSLRIPAGIIWDAVTIGEKRLAISGDFGETNTPDNRILIYNLETGSLYRQLNIGASSPASMSFDPDESSLFVVYSSADPQYKGLVCRWDVATSTLLDSSNMATQIVEFDFDGKRIAGGWKNALLIAPTNRFATDFYFIGPEYAMSILDFDLDEDNGRLICANMADAMIWDLKRGTVEQKWSPTGEYQTIRKIRFNGRSIVTAGFKGAITNWDSAGQIAQSSMQHSLLNLSNLTHVQDDIFASSGTGIPSLSEDTLRFWNVRDGTVTDIKTAHCHKINCMRKSPDGQFWITGGGEDKLSGGGGGLRIWDAGTWTPLKDIRLSDSSLEVSDVIIYPDNKTAVVVTDKASRMVIDLSSGTVLRRIDDSLNYGVLIEMSPDGKTYACGNGDPWLSISRDYDIRLYDSKSHALIKILRGHRQAVTRIKFTRDGRSLVSSSWDGTIKFWNLSNTEVTTLAGPSDDTYAVFTENGNYMTSKAGRELVAFRQGMRLMTFEQFDLTFNRPDIVLGRLGFIQPELLSVYQKASQKRQSRYPGISNNWTQQNGPELRVITETPPETSERNAKLKIVIRDAKSTLSRLKILVNDVPMYGRAGLDLRHRNIRTLEIDIPIVLSPGKNRIRVSAMNLLGAESLPEIFETTFVGTPESSDLIVVAIGVAKYKDAEYNLTYSRKDALEVSSVFKALQKNAAAHFEDILLVDSNATRENILAVRKRLMDTKPNDRVVLFFAGHGLLDDKLDWYFATHDIDFSNPSGRGLAYSEIEELLDGIPARRRLVLMDACHSGEVDKGDPVALVQSDTDNSGGVQSRGIKRKKIGSGESAIQTVSSRGFKSKKSGSTGLKDSFELMREMFADLQNGVGATVISSASGTEVALEGGEWKNGVFTYAVLQGLAYGKADVNGDHLVRCSELQSYVMKAVRSLTGGKQTPTARKEKLIDDFELGGSWGDIDAKEWRLAE